MLVALLKKTDYDKVTEIENKLNNHNHDKYIDTQEFNKLAADVFLQIKTGKSGEKNQILIIQYEALIVKLLKIKQKASLLRTN